MDGQADEWTAISYLLIWSYNDAILEHNCSEMTTACNRFFVLWVRMKYIFNNDNQFCFVILFSCHTITNSCCFFYDKIC